MSNKKRGKQERRKFKRSLLATSIIAFSSIPYAVAQSDGASTEASTEEGAALVEELVVRGIRRSIETAQEIKRNANTVVDSITADELGDFPDKSVAEALMRVPGISVERFATSTDTAAFSIEPSGVLIRGLPFVRSEFNGRDSFSATSSRGLSWGDVSPELMGGIDVYKNQTAELIEGGISGLVNLRTRLPFDSEEDLKVLTIGANYSDLSESNTPEVSGIYTTRFDTGIGEFGFMANLAYSDVDATSQSSRMGKVNRFRDVYAEDSLYFIPSSVSVGDSHYSRQRAGAALALQWQDYEGRFLTTFQYNGSRYDSSSESRGISTSWAGLDNSYSLFHEVMEGEAGSHAIVRPAEGTDPFEFSEDGLFARGTITQDHGWWGANNDQARLAAANANGEPMVETCASLDAWAGCGEGAVLTPYIGASVGTGADVSDSISITEDFGFNVKWNVTDRFHANFDVQHVQSTLDEYRVNTGFNSWANSEVDLSRPLNSVVLHEPTNVNLLPAEDVGYGDSVYVNPNSYYPNHIMEFKGDNEGEEFATRADFVFDVDSGLVERLKAGVRYVDRDQKVNQAGDWHAMSASATWGQPIAAWFNLDSEAHEGEFDGEPYKFNGYPDAWVVDRWESDYGSVSVADAGEYSDYFVFPNTDTMRDWRYTMDRISTGQPAGGFEPICSGLGVRSEEVGETCFRPNESLHVTEESKALYLQMDFGGDDLNLFGRPITGNIGARYVETDVTSFGGEQFPNYDLEERPCQETEPLDPNDPDSRPPVPNTVTCYMDEDDFVFMNNAGNLGVSTASHYNVLPSLNVKYDVTDNFVTRLAVSRAMSRPDIGSLRNYIRVSGNWPDVDEPSGSLWVKDENGEIVGADVLYTATSANPFLKPTIADQVDVSFEYYTGPNSASLALFAKSFDDYIQTGTYIREMTNNGITKDVVITGPINGDGAKIQGLEIQGTHLFEYLPGVLGGLGVQANYTYVDNQGIKNANVNSSSSEGVVTGSAAAADRIDVDHLEGLSKDTFNISTFYEQNRLSVRLSYNWRSEYLVTVQDCCVGTPIWQDDYGQLDASIRYRINETFDLSLSGSNLTDQKAVLTQQMENSQDGGDRLKYAINQSDTRYTLRLRAQF